MKLIKINEDHYIIVIVDSSDIKEGDVMYDIDGDIGIAIGKDKSQWEGNMKIIYSFGKKIDGVINKPLSEVEELLFGYSVKKMVDESFDNMGFHSTVTPYEEDQFKLGYKLGFNTHKELTKDKLFTVDDMRNVFILGGKHKVQNPDTFLEKMEKIIQSLQPTEWEVEFINGKLTLKQ